MGNFPLFAYANCQNDDPDGCAPFIKRSRAVPFNATTGSPGYWAVQLSTGIIGEMTVTAHAALYRFTFPNTTAQSNGTSPFFISDLTDLYDSRSAGAITVDQATGRMMGSGTFEPGFGDGTYPSYFCADFAGAPLRDSGIWSGSTTTNATTLHVSSQAQQGGAWARFGKPAKNNQMISRVGVSLISTAQACSNAESEIPNFRTAFKSVRTAATKAWSDKLNVVSITPGGASTDAQRLFWTSAYRAFISPQDYTNENPKWTSSEPYFDSYYCIWDSFRAQHP